MAEIWLRQHGPRASRSSWSSSGSSTSTSPRGTSSRCSSTRRASPPRSTTPTSCRSTTSGAGRGHATSSPWSTSHGRGPAPSCASAQRAQASRCPPIAARHHRRTRARGCTTRTRSTDSTASRSTSSTATCRPQNMLVTYEGGVKVSTSASPRRPDAAHQTAGGHAQGQVQLHVPRAGPRGETLDSAHRHVRAGHRAVRDARRPAPVQARQRAGHHAGHPRGRGPPRLRAARGRASRAG